MLILLHIGNILQQLSGLLQKCTFAAQRKTGHTCTCICPIKLKWPYFQCELSSNKKLRYVAEELKSTCLYD